MSTGKRVVRNSIFGIASQAVGGGIYFLCAILMARHLGPEHFGTFSFIFAFVTVFQMLADFGLTNILVREISRQKERLKFILGAVIPLVTLMALLTSAILWASAQWLTLAEDALLATYIMGASVLVTFHAAVYASVSRAFEQMGFNATGLILQRGVLLIGIILALFTDAGLPAFALCYLLERLAQWLFFYLLVTRRYTRYTWRIDWSYWKYLVVEGLPVGLGMVLRRISWHIDIFILGALATTSAVGLFSAAYRVVQMLNVLPFTLSVPVFPVLSRHASKSHAQAFGLYQQFQKVFMLLGIPLGLWLAILGPQAMIILYGEAFAQAGVAMRIMGLVTVLIFLNSLYVYLFSSLNKQRFFMIGTAISVAVNIALDFLLIPSLGIAGAALGTLCAEFTLFAAGLIFLHRLNLPARYLNTGLKITGAALLSSAFLLWPLTETNLWSLALASLAYGILYAIVILLLGVVSKSEIQLLLGALPGKKPKAPLKTAGANS